VLVSSGHQKNMSGFGAGFRFFICNLMFLIEIKQSRFAAMFGQGPLPTG
jgi:hypothetical protein